MGSRGLNVFVNIGAKLLPSLNSAAGKIEQRFGQMNRKLRLQAAETKVAYKEIAGAMKPVAAMAAAGGLSMGFSKAIGSGASFMHEVAAMRIAGRTAGEVGLAIKQAHKTMAEVPTSTLTDNLKLLRETTGAYGDLKHAMENLSFNQRMGYSMVNVAGMAPDEAMHSLVAGIQALEIRGSAMDPHRYQHEMNSLFQAMAFFAGKEGAFTPGSLRDFSKTGNVPLKMYSERFMSRILPAMITEVGSGDIIGTQATAFNGWLLGRVGANNKKAVEYAAKLGLIEPGGLITKAPGKKKKSGWKVLADGAVKHVGSTGGAGDNFAATGWKAGSMVGTNMALADPLMWMEKILLPKLAKSGVNIKDGKALNIALSQLMTKETSRRFAIALTDPLQRARLHKDEANINKAMSSEEGYKFMLAQDPTAAWAKVMAKMDNLATVLGEKVFTDKTIAAIDKLASGIDRLVNWFGGDGTKKNPGHPMAAAATVAGMGGGALLAMGSLFGIGLRMSGGIVKGLTIGLGRGLVFLLGTLPMRLGPLFLNGLAMVAPWLLRGLGMAFGILTGPIGWALMAASAAALIYAYRDKIAGAWHFVSDWFAKSAWPAITNTVSALGDVGGKIVDAIIKGLSGAWSRIASWWSEKWSALGASVSGIFGGGGSAPVPVTPGPKPYTGTAPAAVMPARSRASGSAAGGATVHAAIHVNGAQDPHHTARVVRQEIKKLASSQSTYLSD